MPASPLRSRCFSSRGTTRRRGVALVLVLITVVLTATLAYSFISVQGTSINVAHNIRNHAKARYVAESGLELAVAYVRASADWRTEQSQGTWITDEPFGEGTFTIVGEDGQDLDGDGAVDGDGDLTDDSGDRLTLTVTGSVNGSTHVVRAVLTPQGDSALVGHWKLDESEGLTAADASGNEYDGVLTNIGVEPGWEAGQVDGGLHLDGYNDFVRVPDEDAFDLSDQGALALWVRMHGFSNFAGMIHKGDAKNFSDEAYTLQFWNNSKIYFGLVGSPQKRTLQGNTSLQTNRWHHVVAAWDPSGIYIYVDGNLDKSSGYAVSVKNSSGGLNIGAQLPVYYNGSYRNLPFNGVIDDVRIYNRSLTAEEVTAIYNGEDSGGDGAQTSVQIDWVGGP